MQIKEMKELREKLAAEEGRWRPGRGSTGPDLLISCSPALGMPTLDAPAGNNSEVEQVRKELAKAKKSQEEAVMKEAKLRKEFQEAGRKLKEQEGQGVRVAQLEKELARKNQEVIKREMANQELQRKLEGVEEQKKKLAKDMESGAEVEAMKAGYEEEKWKNLATISSLQQQKADFCHKVKELTALVESLEAKNEELKTASDLEIKTTKDNEVFEKIVEKKDRQIGILEAKLRKANDPCSGWERRVEA